MRVSSGGVKSGVFAGAPDFKLKYEDIPFHLGPRLSFSDAFTYPFLAEAGRQSWLYILICWAQLKRSPMLQIILSYSFFVWAVYNGI